VLGDEHEDGIAQGQIMKATLRLLRVFSVTAFSFRMRTPFQMIPLASVSETMAFYNQ
jgi:hypothetical protein